MKRLLFGSIAIAASLLAASCAKEADTDGGAAAPVSFTTNTAILRGTPIASAADIPDMGVFAWYTGNGAANNWAAKGATAAPGFMDNVQVVQNGASWGYGDPVYWPQAADANVTFFAYSPYATDANGIAITETTGSRQIHYSVPASCADQPDLMVAPLVTDLNKSQGQSPVSFEMRHALTSIGFKVTGDTSRTITGIALVGVSTSAILSVADDGTPAWSDHDGYGFFSAILPAGGVTISPAMSQVNTDDGFLMMIPQTAGDAATLSITLDNSTTIDFDLAGQVWEPGDKIMYNITIDPEELYVGYFAGELKADADGVWQYERQMYVTAKDVLNTSWQTALVAAGVATNVSDGKLNTLNLNLASSTNFPAANLCFQKNSNYSAITGVNDANYVWYLPAADQQMAMWIVNNSYATAYRLSRFTWSSIESFNEMSRCMNFAAGTMANSYKTNSLATRCVREAIP